MGKTLSNCVQVSCPRCRPIRTRYWGGKMSRSQDTSLCSSIARYAKLLGIGAVASLLVVSVGHTQKMGNGPPSNNPGNGPPADNPGNGPPANNPGQTKREAASDRAL